MHNVHSDIKGSKLSLSSNNTYFETWFFEKKTEMFNFIKKKINIRNIIIYLLMLLYSWLYLPIKVYWYHFDGLISGYLLQIQNQTLTKDIWKKEADKAKQYWQWSMHDYSQILEVKGVLKLKMNNSKIIKFISFTLHMLYGLQSCHWYVFFKTKSIVFWSHIN